MEYILLFPPSFKNTDKYRLVLTDLSSTALKSSLNSSMTYTGNM